MIAFKGETIDGKPVFQYLKSQEKTVEGLVSALKNMYAKDTTIKLNSRVREGHVIVKAPEEEENEDDEIDFESEPFKLRIPVMEKFDESGHFQLVKVRSELKKLGSMQVTYLARKKTDGTFWIMKADYTFPNDPREKKMGDHHHVHEVRK